VIYQPSFKANQEWQQLSIPIQLVLKADVGGLGPFEEEDS